MKKWLLIITAPLALAFVIIGIMLLVYVESGEDEAKHENSILEVTEYKNSKRSVPNRPAKVPSDALWVGGVDGGVWIQTKKFETKRASLKIFDDFSGDVLSDSWFTLSPGCEFENVDQMTKVFGAFDGEKIILHKEDPKNPGRICSMKLDK